MGPMKVARIYWGMPKWEMSPHQDLLAFIPWLQLERRHETSLCSMIFMPCVLTTSNFKDKVRWNGCPHCGSADSALAGKCQRRLAVDSEVLLRWAGCHSILYSKWPKVACSPWLHHEVQVYYLRDKQWFVESTGSAYSMIMLKASDISDRMTSLNHCNGLIVPN